MSGEPTTTTKDSGTTVPTPRLDSWKEIAVYLKRSARTVRRWERQEGMPVRRHLHGKEATVYAFAQEIEDWLKGRSVGDNGDQPPSPNIPQSFPQPSSDTDQKTRATRPVVIAILPLRNVSGDPEQEGFVDGLTEELISEIGHSSPKLLRVIALTSVMQYKQSTKSIGAIGRELGVDYILEGGIRRYGRRVRLTARLIAARDQANIWGGSYEIQLTPFFSLQQALAKRLANSLSAQLGVTPKERQHRTIPHGVAAHNA